MTNDITGSRLSNGTSILAADSPANSSEEENKELANELAKATMQHDVQMAALGLQETRANLADVANARENQYRIQESEHSSWLTKNAQALLAFSITGATFILFTVVIIGGSKDGFLKPETKDIVIYILGALTTVSTQVVSYYFGSSTGSADKSRALNSIVRRNNP